MPGKPGRFLTPESGVAQLLKQRRDLHFSGRTREEWQEWRRKFRRRLAQYLGPRPEAVPLQVEVLEEVELPGCVRRKIVFDPDPFSSVPAYVLIPTGVDASRPAVLCAHGHGVGKEALAGDTGAEYLPGMR